MIAWFVHGWAFSPAIWQPLAALLPGVEPRFADAGYFGPRDLLPPCEPAVWIAHSFGTMLALGAMTAACRGLVAINGFARFAGKGGVARRVLDLMLRRFDEDPAAVVGEFRRRCGAEEPWPAAGDIATLRQDLLAMRDGDGRAAAARLAVPVLALHGARDPILPQAMREGTFAEAADITRREHPQGGHLLPVQDPAWCAEHIAGFLARVRA